MGSGESAWTRHYVTSATGRTLDKGDARGPTRSTKSNAPLAYEFGPQVSDAIAERVVKGLAFGPVKEEDLSLDVKVNSIMCK